MVFSRGFISAREGEGWEKGGGGGTIVDGAEVVELRSRWDDEDDAVKMRDIKLLLEVGELRP